MKNNNNEQVKSEIFERLAASPRFAHIVTTVIDMFRHGQNPVTIESWNTHSQKFKPTDEIWDKFMMPEETQKFREFCKKHAPVKITSKAILNADNPELAEADVVVCVTGDNSIFKDAYAVPKECMDELIYWGYKDKNYLKLFFSYLGYNVTEGQQNGKYGLLISLS